MLGVFTFGSSGFKSLDSSNNIDPVDDGCFGLARSMIIERDGEINISNIDDVRYINFICEFYGIA